MFMRARRPERALDMYNYMLAAGIQPNFTTYSYLVESIVIECFMFIELLPLLTNNENDNMFFFL
jgi:pentatricopeptide repeat protein